MRVRNEIVFIVVAIVLVALLVVGFIFFRGSDGESEEILPGQTLTRAREGRVISDFPQELLLEDRVAIGGSYTIEYRDDDKSQPVVEYTSSLSLGENIDLFRTYLLGNGWEIAQDPNTETSVLKFFYAQRKDEGVNITFIPQRDSLTVQISYVQG